MLAAAVTAMQLHMTYLLPHSYTGTVPSQNTASLAPWTASVLHIPEVGMMALSLSWQLVTINSVSMISALLRNTPTKLFTASDEISVSGALHRSPWTGYKCMCASSSSAGASPAYQWEVGHEPCRASAASS